MPNEGRKPKHILLIHGPMFCKLGERECAIYGTDTLEELEGWIITRAQKHHVEINTFQSESEGDIIRFMLDHCEEADGVIINPGAYAHYSYAIMEAIRFMPCPVVEVHLTNIFEREEFRKNCVTAMACDGMVTGLGKHGYISALGYLLELNLKDEVDAD